MYTDSQARDCHTFRTVTPSHIFHILQETVPITIDRLACIARVTDDPTVIAVPANSEISGLQDVISVSAAAEGGLKWGTTFTGGIDHVNIHNLAKRADGVPQTIVPFQAAATSSPALSAGMSMRPSSTSPRANASSPRAT
jgi:tripartite-type tricarboxylate transporter receptor subunit TctC